MLVAGVQVSQDEIVGKQRSPISSRAGRMLLPTKIPLIRTVVCFGRMFQVCSVARSKVALVAFVSLLHAQHHFL